MSLLCSLTDSQMRIAEAIGLFHDAGRFIQHLHGIAATLPTIMAFAMPLPV